ncbi:zinc finger (Ran-binding) family protein [Actinidia rufa]|uniref:Zinc finger (Ran-binding) family protein n=1 Tax=Actinidia rufa TaxID=165716 RepID=A0A7J0FJI1_9ERIC|nr:zinc finger (Ran-binding) family protein [Actinidia rufa]
MLVRRTLLMEKNVGTGRSPSLSSYGHPKGSNSSYVPFVTLPNDMFSKNPQKVEDGEKVVTESYDSVSSKASEQTSSVSLSSETGKSLDSSYGKPSNQAESLDKEKEQTEKSETGFKKVAELYDSVDSASATSDDDFPEFMPMRKGENRFVVSKKKDRSLTSLMYKRRMAMEQTGSANFVPFVPFPPDYFAKKDKQNPDGEDSTVKATGRLNLQTSGDFIERKSGVSYESPISGNLTQNSFNSQNKNQDAWSTGFSGKESGIEPDPLDMSEEAKAQRWFRRVAQIKDISELSNIPDEDFPSIMPMRKGVNRFVVSKRKTPLERRLTSPQYRRNLPIVSLDPVKKENENS